MDPYILVKGNVTIVGRNVTQTVLKNLLSALLHHMHHLPSVSKILMEQQ